MFPMLRKPFLAFLFLTLAAGFSVPAAAQTCAANSSWVNNPTLPESVPGNEGNHCDFAIFSWQSFLALTEPANNNQLVFETYMSWDGLFVASGKPNAWGNTPWPPTLGELNKQAGSGNDLIAQSGAEVLYDMSVNQTMYNYVTNNLLYTQNCFNNGGMNIHMPPTTDPSTGAGSIELKTAWLPMTTCDSTKYYCQKAVMQGGNPITVALIGIHIVHKIDDHQEWIWTSFEHIDNAPDCAKVTAPPSGYSSWNFFDSDFVPVNSACNTCNNFGGTNCNAATQCNTYTTETASPNVCRTTQLMSLGCNTSDTNLNDDTNDVVCLNQSVWNLLPSNSVWRNYMLVGTLWFRPGMSAPATSSSPFPPTGQTEVGNTTLANTVMETYTQMNNCYNCHQTSFQTVNASTPGTGGHADFSHLFNRIQQVGPSVSQCPTLTTSQASHGTKAAAPAAAPVKPMRSHEPYGNKKK